MVAAAVFVMCLLAGLGSGLVGGVFFAFSSFVLPALARLPSPQGLLAMQSINVVVLNRSFLGVFLGTAALCVLALLDSALRTGITLRTAGAVCYLAGSLGVTRLFNVPYNEAISGVAPAAHDAALRFRWFVHGWSRWNHLRTAASLLAAACFALGSSGCQRYWECGAPEAGRQAQLPERLSQTGLFVAGEPEHLAEGVREFTPAFELWSDGAAKRRWIRLPPGERIDTSDIDDWSFPVGTQLWKEFSVGGVRVETRSLRRTGTGADDWATLSYVWLADGSDAVASPAGVEGALGTPHDVPPASVCRACHGGRKSFVLGFSALQLAKPAERGQLVLAELVENDWLSHAPGEVAVSGGERDRSALGYLHANCGHCHNQDRPTTSGARCYDPRNELDFWLKAERAESVSDTPAYRSGLGLAFEPGKPDDSRMIELMSQRGLLRQMPPLGTKVVDRRGVQALRDWIASRH